MVQHTNLHLILIYERIDLQAMHFFDILTLSDSTNARFQLRRDTQMGNILLLKNANNILSAKSVQLLKKKTTTTKKNVHQTSCCMCLKMISETECIKCCMLCNAFHVPGIIEVSFSLYDSLCTFLYAIYRFGKNSNNNKSHLLEIFRIFLHCTL